MGLIVARRKCKNEIQYYTVSKIDSQIKRNFNHLRMKSAYQKFGKGKVAPLLWDFKGHDQNVEHIINHNVDIFICPKIHNLKRNIF